jgi:P4 family phage/plasmid primase-like protien
MADHIQKLYSLLGAETVLLPAVQGEKRPVPSRWEDEFKKLRPKPDFEWQKVRFADTQVEEYQEQLVKGNVGVALGSVSGGLCAIDIDDDQDMETFFDLNPGLRHSLVTRGARGCQIWIRCIEDTKYRQLQLDSYPKKTHPLKFKMGFRNKVNKAGVETAGQFGEWRSDGGQSIIYGRHPDGHNYSFINEAPVISVRFRDIVWPPTLDQLPWSDQVDEALTRIYGDPWVPDGNGDPKQMIEPFWAGLFAYRHEVVYEKDEERFYLYDPKRGLWERATDQDVSYRGTQMMLEVSREQHQPVLQGPRFRGAAKLSAVNNHLKGIVGDRGIFKQQRGLIHLKNGMIDLQDSVDGALRLMPHSPDYFSRNQIPVAFDAEAECPKFLNDLLGAGLCEDDIKLMQRWGGLLLLQDNMFQKIMILTGTPGGGKSTVMAVFQKMVGQDNCAQLRTEQLLERFEMAAFIGKSTLIGADVPGNFLMQRGSYKLKQLTGGDFFQAEIKTARDLVTLYGNFNIGITCNSRLRVAMDSDAGAWDRRLVIIKYEAPKPKNPINNFADWLVENEGPGILNWMIEGALELLAEKKFQMTEGQKGTVKDLLEESDSVRSFLRRCVQPAGRNDDVTTDELIEAYHEFCDAKAWDAVAAGTLEKHLPNLMLELFRVTKQNSIKRDGTARRGYKRVRLVKLDDESAIYDESADESYSQRGLIDDDSASYGKGGV